MQDLRKVSGYNKNKIHTEDRKGQEKQGAG